MAHMTSRERFKRMFDHQEADRVPVIDVPWGATVERWRREGMPDNIDYVDFFGLDHTSGIAGDISPQYEEKVIEETDEYVIATTKWGVTTKNWKHMASTPEYLHFTITDRKTWHEAKERMTLTRDRVDWAYLQREYPKWRERGDWLSGGLWFGFDVTHARMVGTERLLRALFEDPDWCVDMFSTCLDASLRLLDMIWNEGYTFDCVFWCDDLGYRNNTFFSVDTYRAVLKPVHKRAVDWAHAKGIKAHLHSCGNVMSYVPEFLDIGIDALNPLEIKAGMDPIALKRQFGNRLVLHGGVNAMLWDNIEAIEAEMRKVVPTLKESGGYIFSSDHSVPSSVSLKNFRHIVELAKTLGAYE